MPKWLDKQLLDAQKMVEHSASVIDSEALEQALAAIQEELEEKGNNMEEKFPEKSQAYLEAAGEFENLKDELVAAREEYEAKLDAVKEFSCSLE